MEKNLKKKVVLLEHKAFTRRAAAADKIKLKWR